MRWMCSWLALTLTVALSGCGTSSAGGGGGVWVPDAQGDGGVAGAGVDGAALVDGQTGADSSGATDVVMDAAGIADGSGGMDAPALADSGGNDKVCAPGATQLCLCAPQVEGVQICSATGTSWGPCNCAPADAGTVDAGAGTGDSGGAADAGNPWNINCLERAKHVYVLTQGKLLLRFEPDKNLLTQVGKLTCPFPGGNSPFSMAVDRNAVAWLLDQPLLGGGGSLYKASTLDANCSKTFFQPGQQGFQLFGMGFASNGPGSQDETLFIAGGGASNFTTAYGSLGTISFSGLTVNKIAKLQAGPGAPELTGNGAGQLFGFYPNTSPPSVRQIVKTTGATGKIWPLPANVLGNVQAWAFAQWGGGFYLFFKSQSAASSAVHRLDGASGKMVTVIQSSGHVIVGAGVSSCAPTKLE